MSDRTERSAEWIYRGVWRVLTDCFRVPSDPPSLPAEPSSFCRTFQPSRRYLAYLKLYFWIGLLAIDLAILAGWVLLLAWEPWVGWLAAIPMLVIAVVPDLIAYVAIHLRYDTMWYVMTDRSLRTRRGIWVILEHTITFENVQNVFVRRGPIERLFGLSNVVVETAGSAEGEQDNPFAVGNKAVIAGIQNAEEIRTLILERVSTNHTTGLGDERRSSGWTSRQLALLREIRDEVRELA